MCGRFNAPAPSTIDVFLYSSKGCIGVRQSIIMGVLASRRLQKDPEIRAGEIRKQ
jgi:hypothetical protein